MSGSFSTTSTRMARIPAAYACCPARARSSQCLRQGELQSDTEILGVNHLELPDGSWSAHLHLYGHNAILNELEDGFRCPARGRSYAAGIRG